MDWTCPEFLTERVETGQEVNVMGDNKALFNQYQLLVARNKDLKQELDTKTKEWQKQGDEFKVTEKLIRELCESILTKDASENKLGKEGSWSDYTTNDMIRKAKTAFTVYCKQWIDKLSEMMDEMERRRKDIEVLTMQNSQMMIQAGSGASGEMTQEDLDNLVKQKESEQKFNKNKPSDTKATVLKATEDEGESSVEGAEDMYDDIDEIQANANPLPNSLPVSQSRQSQQDKQSIRKKAQDEKLSGKYLAELSEITSDMDELEWGYMEAIGEHGISYYPEIEKFLMKKFDGKYSSNTIRLRSVKILGRSLLSKQVIPGPLNGRITLYYFTPTGRLVYERKFGKPPVESERDMLIREHDNAVHGYGIKMLAEKLKDTGQFKSVIYVNGRQKIKTPDGSEYIPDITCETKGSRKIYLEYECGTTTQTDFYAKCQKVSRVTDTLNFVGPNRDIMEHLRDQVVRWIDNRGADALKGLTIRVASASRLVESKSIVNNESWNFVFQPGKKGSEPIVH